MSASNSNGAGQAFRFEDRPGAYAHYPHARRVGDLLFISGMKCRRPDNSHAGVVSKTAALGGHCRADRSDAAERRHRRAMRRLDGPTH